jgi:hypothetical protein
LRRSRSIADGVAPQPIDQVTPGNEHDPGHELRPPGVVAIRSLPEPYEDLLNRILCFGPAGQELPGHLVHEGAEAVVQLRNRTLVAIGDAMHQQPVVLAH